MICPNATKCGPYPLNLALNDELRCYVDKLHPEAQLQSPVNDNGKDCREDEDADNDELPVGHNAHLTKAAHGPPRFSSYTTCIRFTSLHINCAFLLQVQTAV